MSINNEKNPVITFLFRCDPSSVQVATPFRRERIVILWSIDETAKTVLFTHRQYLQKENVKNGISKNH